MPTYDPDRRNLPAYTYSEASRAIRMPTSTLRAWTRGQDGFEPVFSPAGDNALSYFNLIEGQVLRAIRQVHRVAMWDVRQALEEANEQYGVDRLLIHHQFRFGAYGLFLDRYSSLVRLTPAKQIAMRRVMESLLERVEYGEDGFPNMFYPAIHDGTDAQRIVRLNPFVSFGRPTVATRGVTTQAIVSRIDAGESVDFVAADYRIGTEEVEEAIYYEAA